MKNFTKAVIVAFGVAGAFAAVPASAQTYNPYAGDPSYGGYDQEDYGNGYDDAYARGAYGEEGAYGDEYAIGYCDQYGCPEDYYDLPIYDGQVYYDNGWLTGPLYYRDWGGRRQFWIRGGWRHSQYRGGNFRRALGRSWYQQNRGYRRGYGNRNAWRGNYGGYRQRNYDGFSQQRNFGGRSSFAPNSSGQNFRGNNDWRSQWGNRQGFGQNGGGGFRQRNFQSQQQQQTLVAPQQQRSFGGGGLRQRNFGAQQSFGGDRRSWRQNQAAQQQAAPQVRAAPQAQVAP
ncbi:MAG: hypothetical protein RL274_1188 [Pseudomonadota bacterium]